jgi:hypothetical protein
VSTNKSASEFLQINGGCFWGVLIFILNFKKIDKSQTFLNLYSGSTEGILMYFISQKYQKYTLNILCAKKPRKEDI